MNHVVISPCFNCEMLNFSHHHNVASQRQIIFQWNWDNQNPGYQMSPKNAPNAMEILLANDAIFIPNTSCTNHASYLHEHNWQLFNLILLVLNGKVIAGMFLKAVTLCVYPLGMYMQCWESITTQQTYFHVTNWSLKEAVTIAKLKVSVEKQQLNCGRKNYASPDHGNNRISNHDYLSSITQHLIVYPLLICIFMRRSQNWDQ